MWESAIREVMTLAWASRIADPAFLLPSLPDPPPHRLVTPARKRAGEEIVIHALLVPT
jgi:hypothetical protein